MSRRPPPSQQEREQDEHQVGPPWLGWIMFQMLCISSADEVAEGACDRAQVPGLPAWVLELLKLRVCLRRLSIAARVAVEALW